jgi:Winged helix DNA-binding domain
MRERILSTPELNRALLARQLLLERSRGSLTNALERLAGLQTQYAPSGYIGLWSRLERFGLSDLTRALEQRRVVQGTLMRSTIHIVSARDYWPFAAGVGPSREEHWVRTHKKQVGAAPDLESVRAELRRELRGRTWNRAELEALLSSHDSTIWHGAWVELVRVPPSGTWERRRADLFRLAEEWLGSCHANEETGLTHLLRRYLGGFGPATLAEAANWAGVPVAKLEPAARTLQLRTFRDEQGTTLLDLPRAPLPRADVPTPARFLPTWDATLLVHARRTQILPEHFRTLVFNTKTPHSVSTFLVDGAVAGTWRIERTARRAVLVLRPYEPLPRGALSAVRDEGARLVRFAEPGAASYAVRQAR